jgi:hypothetical protein
MASSKRKRRLVIAAGVVAGYAVGTLIARSQGYSFGRTDAGREFAAGHRDVPVP